MMIVQSCSISIHDAHLGFHLSPVEVGELMLMQPIGSSLGFALMIYLVMMQEVVSDWDATRVGSSPSMLAIRMMYMSPFGNDTWVTGVVLHHCPCA